MEGGMEGGREEGGGGRKGKEEGEGGREERREGVRIEGRKKMYSHKS